MCINKEGWWRWHFFHKWSECKEYYGFAGEILHTEIYTSRDRLLQLYPNSRAVQLNLPERRITYNCTRCGLIIDESDWNMF